MQQSFLLPAVALILFEPLTRRVSPAVPGSGWPALLLALGVCSREGAWLVTGYLMLRLVALQLFTKDRLVAVEQAKRSAPVLLATWVALAVPPGYSVAALLVCYGTVALALFGGRNDLLYSLSSELLWGGFLIGVTRLGTWPLSGALLAFLLVFARTGSDEGEKERGFSRQMRVAERTLKASQSKFDRDRGRYEQVLSIVAVLDDFQGKALATVDASSVAKVLLDTLSQVEPGLHASVWRRGELLAGRKDATLESFTFPSRSHRQVGGTVWSPEADRLFHFLTPDVVLVAERMDATVKRDWLQHLLARAGLILQIQEQRRELAQLLTQKTSALERLAHSQELLLQTEKLAAIGQLAAGVAHELNSPLAAISMQVQMARRRLTKQNLDGVSASLDKLELAAGAAKSIIENLLTYSRVPGKNRTESAVDELLKQSLELLKPRFEENQISVDLKMDAGLPLLSVNRAEVSEVFHIILNNAVDALREASGSRRIEVSVSSSDGEVVVVIANNGPALEEEVLSRVFDPFFTTKDIGQGTGLGLSIAHEFVKGHQGRLQARNYEGQVQFGVFLPVKDYAEPKA